MQEMATMHNFAIMNGGMAQPQNIAMIQPEISMQMQTQSIPMMQQQTDIPMQISLQPQTDVPAAGGLPTIVPAPPTAVSPVAVAPISVEPPKILPTTNMEDVPGIDWP